jgi:predicted O-linked N-acetylglucosamine transferase (SPINDLY family)
MSETSLAIETLKTALVHLRAGRLSAVRETCRAVLDADPRNADALHLLGVVAHAEGDLSSAGQLIARTLTINPGFAAAYDNLGVVFGEDGHLFDAMMAFRTAIALGSGDREAHRHLLSCLLYIPGVPPEARLAAHLEFAAAYQPPADAVLPPPPNDRDPNRRLRIGLLSSDFRAHPIARNLMAAFVHRDRNANELLCYAEVRTPDGYSDLIRTHCDGWRSTIDLGDRAVAEMIRGDGIDLLVVLAARFDRNRPLVACYRPAPVQISMFDGATTGLRGIDYWITDPILAPAGNIERFTERLVQIPMLIHCLPFEHAPAVAALPALGAGFINFGAFYNPIKISTATVELWARILRAVAGSRLTFKYRQRYADPMLQMRLRTAFGARGIEPDRLRFLFAQDQQTEHLSTYGTIDIALDTTPFSGSTTTFDALWMGVPVVTLTGDTMVSRMSAGLLSAAGVADLIADTSDAFVARVQALAGDLAGLSALRATLRDRVGRSGLCDGPAYARSLEAMWRALWQAWCVTA